MQHGSDNPFPHGADARGGQGLHPHPLQEVTRLAPSPTGALHLGNARTFLVNWALARRGGWKIVLRIEDLDGPRIKPGAIEQTIDLLRWLGIDWDSGPFIQSSDLAPYAAAMQSLASLGMAYPSDVSRGEVESAASAPQEGVHEVVFPPSLRPEIRPRDFDDRSSAWRFLVDETRVCYTDRFGGLQSFEPSSTIGDFLIWTKRGQPAYQLAVVVDDHRQRVTQIVRGDDLLESAARQILLYRALGYEPLPTYTHLPLVRGDDGRRLAKRHGDTRLDTYRARGVPSGRVIALLARWCGMEMVGDTMSAAEFSDRLDITRIPRSDVVFSPEDDRWLRAM